MFSHSTVPGEEALMICTRWRIYLRLRRHISHKTLRALHTSMYSLRITESVDRVIKVECTACKADRLSPPGRKSLARIGSHLVGTVPRTTELNATRLLLAIPALAAEVDHVTVEGSAISLVAVCRTVLLTHWG